MLQCSVLGVAGVFLSLIFFHVPSASSLSCCHPFSALGKLTLGLKLGNLPSQDKRLSPEGGGPPFSKACSHRDGPDKLARSVQRDVCDRARTMTSERDAAPSFEEKKQTKKLQVETLFRVGTLEAELLKTAADESRAEPTVFNI